MGWPKSCKATKKKKRPFTSRQQYSHLPPMFNSVSLIGSAILISEQQMSLSLFVFNQWATDMCPQYWATYVYIFYQSDSYIIFIQLSCSILSLGVDYLFASESSTTSSTMYQLHGENQSYDKCDRLIRCFKRKTDAISRTHSLRTHREQRCCAR